MTLPPYARRLDVRATRAAFTAGTLSTVRDHPAAVDEQRLVETGDANGYDLHGMKHAGGLVIAVDLGRVEAHAEMVRLARLKRWQAER